MTALAEMDPTLGNKIDIGNKICVLVAIQGDNTPLCPSPFKEEDVLKSCIGVGQEHPECVLKLQDTEEILGFRCESDMMAAIHCLNVAMVWQGKHAVLCILPVKGM